MARARLESDWERTSWVVAMIHNVNCTEKRALKKPDAFNPYRRRRPAARPKPVGTLTLSQVADAFVRGRMPAIKPEPR